MHWIDMEVLLLVFLLQAEKLIFLIHEREKNQTFRAVVWNSFSEAVIWQSGNESAVFIHLKWPPHLMAACGKTGREGRTDGRAEDSQISGSRWLELGDGNPQGLGKRQRKESSDNYPQKWTSVKRFALLDLPFRSPQQRRPTHLFCRWVITSN